MPPALIIEWLRISIHAPRKGSDSFIVSLRISSKLFQSTPPARGATDALPAIISAVVISIHAPRKGSDQRMGDASDPMIISIHAPRKGSDFNFAKSAKDKDKFQSTPPARGATFPAAINTLHSQYFNPRPPQGERRSRNFKAVRLYHFNPRPPQGERQERRGQR